MRACCGPTSSPRVCTTYTGLRAPVDNKGNVYMARLATSKYPRGDTTTIESEDHEHECDKCGGINTMQERTDEKWECSTCGDVCDITDFSIRKITIVEFGEQEQKVEEHKWVAPDGQEYVPGDCLPVRHTPEGSYYNEDIIVVHCPGFPGGVCEVGPNGEQIRLPRVEPTSAYYVGPAACAWAWQYRQGQYLLHLASQRRMGDFTE